MLAGYRPAFSCARKGGTAMKRKNIPLGVFLAVLVLALLTGSIYFFADPYGVGRESEFVTVPVLLYHHLGEVQEGDHDTIAPETFARHMKLLREKGYTPVSLQSLLDYAEADGELPEKPVVITFDDGYYSNYQYAFPVLQEYSYPAVIFVIGCSVGHMDYYKDTEYAITPHFGLDEIRIMRASGLISVQSHSWDMHQWPAYESGDAIRKNLLPLEGESEAEYALVLREDIRVARELIETEDDRDISIAYPYGVTSDVTDEILKQEGYKISFSIDSTKRNAVIKGKPETLWGMGRLYITPETTEQSLLMYLAK